MSKAPESMMSRKYHYDGTCRACGRVGATWDDLDDPAGVALCDRCEDAQRRWDDWHYLLAHPESGLSYWTFYREGPPKSPPVRR